MKKIISVILTITAAVFISSTAIAQSGINAYIDGDSVTVFDTAFSAEAKLVFAFYDKNGTLCGASIGKADNDGYIADTAGDFEAVRLCVFNSKNNGIYTLLLSSKAAIEPIASPSPTPSPTEAPIEAMQEEEDWSYSGFYDYWDNEQDNTSDEEVGNEGNIEEKSICTIEINCSNALTYEGIDESLLTTLPKDGVMLTYTAEELTDGMTVYDVLTRAVQSGAVSISGDGSYVSGINGLSEFDCGPLSGWMYSVNGEFPNVPMSMYEINENDEIKLLYTCELGNDL